MIIRDLQQQDTQQIAEIHGRMGMDYALPDLDSPLFLVRKVATNENGKILAACVLRIEAETYLLLDPQLSPQIKMKTMLELQPEILRGAWEQGLDNIVAWVPEAVEKKFKRRLQKLGWNRDRTGWHSWSRSLEESAP